MGLITLLIILAIALCCIPVVAWLVWRSTDFNNRKAAEQRNEIDMKHYQPRFEERRLAEIPRPEDMARRGRYDLEVEELISARRIAEARALCERRLASGELNADAVEMYERYIRVLEEQF